MCSRWRGVCNAIPHSLKHWRPRGSTSLYFFLLGGGGGGNHCISKCTEFVWVPPLPLLPSSSPPPPSFQLLTACGQLDTTKKEKVATAVWKNGNSNVSNRCSPEKDGGGCWAGWGPLREAGASSLMGNQPSWVGRESQHGQHLAGTLQHRRGSSHWTATVRHRNINATHGQDIEQTLTPTTNTPQS